MFDPKPRDVPTDRREPLADRFLTVFAIANVGGVIAYLPLLTLFLPLKVKQIAPVDGLALLTVISVIGAVSASVANIVFGKLSDRSLQRHGSRNGWIVAGLVMMAASYAALELSTTILALIAAIVGFQIAVNALLAPLFAMMADRVRDARKGLAGGWLSIAQPLGWLTGGLLISTDIGEAGRLALLAAVVVTLFVPLLLFGGKPLSAPLGTEPAIGMPASGDRRYDLSLLWGSRAVIQTASTMLYPFMLFYAEKLGVALDPDAVASRIGNLTGVVLILSVPIALAVGRWSDRARARKPFLIATMAAALLGAGAMALATSWLVIVPGYALFVAGTTVFLGLQSATSMQILPSARRHGHDLGLLNLANTAPSIAGPMLVWLLMRHQGHTLIMVAIVGLIALGGALILLLREPWQQGYASVLGDTIPVIAQP